MPTANRAYITKTKFNRKCVHVSQTAHIRATYSESGVVASDVRK